MERTRSDAMKTLLSVLMACLMGAVARAEIRVVATVPNLGMLVRAVGGDAVDVRVLAPSNRDPHYLEARPSMMAALRRADLVVAVGADLEVGWLPAALRGAHNPRIQPGQPGYFEAAMQVERIGLDKSADRALGDVHTSGNPHIYLDPDRMAQIGFALAAHLASLDPDSAALYRAHAESFGRDVADRAPRWRARAASAPDVLAYHSDHDYLLRFLGVEALGYIEPLPGIPPTASHLRALVQELAGREGVIWSMDFHPAQPGDFLSRELGWKSVRLPGQVAVDGDAEAYFRMIDRWVESLEESERE